MKSIAFTGHRPKDLMGKRYLDFRDALIAIVKDRTDLHFVVGGALGVDTWAAEFAIAHGIPFTLVLPFRPEVMGKYWTQLQRHIIHDEPSYDVRAYQLRNEFMVNAADIVLAVWTGKKDGGTANCIRYALQVGKPAYNLWPLQGKLRPITEA